VLWTGFLVLEGFDFGVGMLHGVVGRDEQGRRLAISTIGPLWDGNEVWLIVAAAGTFAAFPGWYATMFSGFYLAIVLLLVALIARGVSFEFRGKRDGAGWRRAWDAATTYGSLLAPLLIGVALGNLLHGVPIGSDQEYAGSLVDLLNPYSLCCGLVLVLLCLLHGASFLALRTSGELRQRALRAGRLLGPLAAVAVTGFAVWTQATAGGGAPLSPPGVVAVVAALAAAWLVGRGRDGRAFAATVGRHGRRGGVDLRQPLPRVMVSTLALGRPHRHQHRLVAVRAEGDDRRRGGPVPGRARLPGMDLLQPSGAGSRDTSGTPVTPDTERAGRGPGPPESLGDPRAPSCSARSPGWRTFPISLSNLRESDGDTDAG
jgi:cytochrome d ubiquinol oxidase subunit II